MIDIYRNGSIVGQIPIGESSTCQQSLTGEDEISINFISSSPIATINVGDYIIFEGRNYYLNRPIKADKVSDVEYRFYPIFEADIYTLLNKLFQQPVTGRGDFSLVDTLDGFLDVLLTNINTINTGWAKGNVPVTERKLLTFDGESCRNILNRLADEFDLEYIVVGKQISFYDIYENATNLTFRHGKGNGLYQLTRDNVDSDSTVTRGYFWGSNKNIDYNYRDGSETRLLFTNPATGTNRIDNFGDFNKVVEKQVIFEDVWPSFEGAITYIDSTDVLKFRCTAIDFDINLYLIEGQTVKVVFKSGDLMGMQFEISAYDHTSKQITLIPYTDEFGLVWPKADGFKPAFGNLFTLVDLRMPQNYIDAAENKLAQKAAEWMEYYSKLRVKYGLSLDPRYLRNNDISLNVGDVVRIIDEDLGIDKQIRVTSIKKNIINPYKITCEISNILEERWQKEISKKVSEALNTAKSASEGSKSGVGSAAYVMDKFFTVKGAVGSEYLLCKFPLASVGEVQAFSNNGQFPPSLWDAMPIATPTVLGGIKVGTNLTIDADGTLHAQAGGGGVSSWAELADKPTWLNYTTLAAFEGGHGHAWGQVTGKPTTLSGYGITDAAAASHVHTFASLTSKPTTVAGFGITDAYTKTNMQTSGAALLHWDNLTNKPSTFAPSTHVHATSEVTGLETTLAGKEPAFAVGTAAQYLRGDKTWQTLNTAAVPEVTNLYFTDARAVAAVSGNAAKVAGQFYTGATNPTSTNRLNYDGYLYATRLYSGAIQVATLTGTETLTNKTLTAPRFATTGFIADANGNELIKFPATIASAVNEITIANAATDGAPAISATGNDSNINLQLSAKGSGVIKATSKFLVYSSDAVYNAPTLLLQEKYSGVDWVPASIVGDYYGGIAASSGTLHGMHFIGGRAPEWSNFIFRRSDGFQLAVIDKDGGLTMHGEVTAYSDMRLKGNIKTLPDDTLRRVLMLNPVSYCKDGKTSVGFVAQEVQPLFPEFVNTHGEYLSLNYSQMVAVLTKAIQELSKKINKLEGRIA